jgi:acyl-CoA dehydrogenase
MSNVTDLIVENVSRIFSDLCTPDVVDSGWNAELWNVLEKNGLTRLAVSEASGGSGGHLRDAASLLLVAGRYAAPLPLSETILAASLLASTGQAIPEGALTVCGGSNIIFHQVEHGWRIEGRADSVPWADIAGHIVIVGTSATGEMLGLVGHDEVRIETGHNIAREPRDRLILDTTLAAGSAVECETGTLRDLQLRGALLRAALMAGASERALELTLSYTRERHQFGQSIGHFQTVQHQVVEMAGEVAALRTASDAAVEIYAAGPPNCVPALMAVASAKAQSCVTATVVSRIAHQLHGAIGFTQEHELRLSTTRLWAWRDEWGNEAMWWSEIGELLLSSNDDVWSIIAAIE